MRVFTSTKHYGINLWSEEDRVAKMKIEICDIAKLGFRHEAKPSA
jgi:hypothetical protein